MDSLMLDGNSAAGLLHDVFGVEMTAASGTCNNCGAIRAVGAAHVFRGAGTVFRCPDCDAVLAKIVTGHTQACVDLSGLRALGMALA